MSWSDLAWPRVAGLPVPHPEGKPSCPLLASAVLAQMEARRERLVRGIAWLVTLAVGVGLWHLFLLRQTTFAGWLILIGIEAGIGAAIAFLYQRMQGVDLLPEQRQHWQRYQRWQRDHAAWLAAARHAYQTRLTPAQRALLRAAVRQDPTTRMW
jgi:hypothetical protein